MYQVFHNLYTLWKEEKARPYEFACDKVLKKRSWYVGLKDIIKPVLNVLFIELLK